MAQARDRGQILRVVLSTVAHKRSLKSTGAGYQSAPQVHDCGPTRSHARLPGTWLERPLIPSPVGIVHGVLAVLAFLVRWA